MLPAMTDDAKAKLLQSLTPEERETIDGEARDCGGIEQLSVQAINWTLAQARAFGEL